jgi:hypothetical protein
MKNIPVPDTDGISKGPDCIPLQINADTLKNVITPCKPLRILPDKAVENNLSAAANGDMEKTAYTKWWIHRISLA